MTNKEKQINDTISRQAAINTLCAICGDDCDKSEFVYNAPQDEQVILCPEHYCLCTLPPAQSEIIRCKDCKFFIDHRCRYWRTLDDWRGTDDFCSKAERKVNEELDI